MSLTLYGGGNTPLNAPTQQQQYFPLSQSTAPLTANATITIPSWMLPKLKTEAKIVASAYMKMLKLSEQCAKEQDNLNNGILPSWLDPYLVRMWNINDALVARAFVREHIPRDDFFIKRQTQLDSAISTWNHRDVNILHKLFTQENGAVVWKSRYTDADLPALQALIIQKFGELIDETLSLFHAKECKDKERKLVKVAAAAAKEKEQSVEALPPIHQAQLAKFLEANYDLKKKKKPSSKKTDSISAPKSHAPSKPSTVPETQKQNFHLGAAAKGRAGRRPN